MLHRTQTAIPIAHDNFHDDFATAAAYARHATSDATRLAYARDVADFTQYCACRSLCPTPATPETLAAYLASLATRLTLPTIRRRLVALSQHHKRYGVPSPTTHALVRAVLHGIARDADVQRRSRPHKKTALTTERLRTLIAAIGTTRLRDLRDRAIVLVGWAAALRRSELAALDLGDLVFEARGVTVCIRSSKTDPYGQGRAIDIPVLVDHEVCAVAALKTYLEAAALTSGPLYRTFARGDVMKPNRIAPIDVARCIKRAARAGDIAGDFAGHSLRRGYITSGIASGASVPELMRRTRHKSQAVFVGYIEEALPFVRNPLSQMLAPTQRVGDTRS